MSDSAFLILFLALTATMACVPFLLKRIGIPPVISLLVVGMLIGDTGIGFNLVPKLSKALSFLNPATLPKDGSPADGRTGAPADATMRSIVEDAATRIDATLAETRQKLDDIASETSRRLNALADSAGDAAPAPEGDAADAPEDGDAEGPPADSGKHSPADPTAAAFLTLIDKLGSLGLMFLMALAGMEADFKLIKSCKKPVILLSTLTFILPAVGGFLLYRWYHADTIPGQLLYASLFASHSVGIVFPVMRELKLSHSRFGASVLIATVITDIASILLLAVAVQLKRQSVDIDPSSLVGTLSLIDRNADVLGDKFLYVFLAIVLAYVSVTIFCVNGLGKMITRRTAPSEDMTVTIILLFILGAALAGELFGINFIVGSFVAGLGLSRVVRDQDMLLFKKFENIGYGFLIPFLFVSIGMQTDFRVFARPGSLSIILWTIAILVGTKIASGYLALRIAGFRHRAGIAAGLMTVPQLSATLTAAAIGRNLDIIDDQFFNAIIILSIVTTLPIPNLVRSVIFAKGDRLPTEDIADFEVPDVVQDTDLL